MISASATNEKKLFSDLAKITLELVGSGSNFIIGLMDDKKGAHQGQFAYDFFDKKANWYTRQFYSANVGISGWAIRNRKEIRINNVGEEYSNYVSEPLEGPMGFQSCLAVPLIANDELIGVISVQSADYRAYTKQHLQVLTIIAQHIAINLQNTRLYQLATLDELTGLFVRRYFDQRLHEEWERARRYGSKFSLAIIDLDHFKNVNDTYGHPVGDEVLKQTGKIIGSNMRSFDIAARYGGEEFVFILPRTGLDGASEVAERIRKDLSNCVVHTSKGPLSVTASIGVTAFPDGDAHTSEELLTLADIALYESKHRGRNQVTLRTKAAHAKAAHAKAETSTHSKETTANSQSRLENTLDTVDMPAISNPSRV